MKEKNEIFFTLKSKNTRLDFILKNFNTWVFKFKPLLEE